MIWIYLVDLLFSGRITPIIPTFWSDDSRHVGVWEHYSSIGSPSSSKPHVATSIYLTINERESCLFIFWLPSMSCDRSTDPWCILLSYWINRTILLAFININRFLWGTSSLGLWHLYPTRYFNFFLFISVHFSFRSVWVNNSSICKIYYVIWLRNESSSIKVFRTKRSKESEKPKNQNTKIPKIKQIPEITKYLKDQNLTWEPKISNILNIF